MSDPIQMLPVPDTSRLVEQHRKMLCELAESFGITYHQISADYKAMLTTESLTKP